MPTPLLMVATATQWLGAARMPRSLANAGFAVSLLVPRGSVAEQSRFLVNVGHLPVNATPAAWVEAFASMVASTSPRLVLPCDDTALRLLMLLALSPPAMLPPALHLQLAALIVDSLGDPAFYRASIDKTMIGPAAAALGVRVPASIVVTALDDAKRFIATHGFPIVIKRSHSTAGEGVALCADQAMVDREFARLMATPALDLDDLAAGQIVLQEFIAGKIHFYTAVAWRGALVSGVAVEKIAGELKGPTSAVRYFASPQMHAATARLTAGFGITGIFSPEFIVDPAGGEPYLLEINRRISHGTHRGARMNVDAGAALYAAMHGTAAPRDQLADGEEHFCAHFPHEWIRDPHSPLLRRLPVDVPWDEPELARALAAIAVRQLGKNPKEPHGRLP
jgi:predicted ATP-grasp superfamily ATP-dependent carboligase